MLSKYPQAESPDNSIIFHMFNNNTYTDFKTAYKHILILSYVINRTRMPKKLNNWLFDKKHSKPHQASICGVLFKTLQELYFFFDPSLFKIWDWRCPPTEKGGLIMWKQMLTQPAITCSKLTIETLGHWRRFGVFIVNLEHISHLCSSVSLVNFEQVNAGWELSHIFFFDKDITKLEISQVSLKLY